MQFDDDVQLKGLSAIGDEVALRLTGEVERQPDRKAAARAAAMVGMPTTQSNGLSPLVTWTGTGGNARSSLNRRQRRAPRSWPFQNALAATAGTGRSERPGCEAAVTFSLSVARFSSCHLATSLTGRRS